MNTQGIGIGRLIVISGFALSCFGLLLFLWLAFGGATPLAPKGYRVQASFTDAVTLAEQADVRIAGVSVGKVVAKEVDPESKRTKATLEIEAKYAPLRRDTGAILRQKTLLGETYVELSPGDPRSPSLGEGGRIPNSAVAETVEFDEFIGMFDKDTRKAFQDWQASAVVAGRGRATDLNDALGTFPSWIEDAGGLVAVLDRRREGIRRLVRNGETTLAAVNRDEAAVRRLVNESAAVFETLAGRRADLAETLRVLPTFQRESRTTLRRLSRFSDTATPVLRDLQPVLEDLRPTLASLRRASPSLQELFRSIPQLRRAADVGAPALARVLRALDPTLAAAGPFLSQINPILRYLEANQPTISDFIGVGPSVVGLKLPAPPDSPSNGHALPQLIVTGGQSLPTSVRSRDNRGTSYFAPGALAGLTLNRDLALPSFDCNHIGGEKGATPGSPACVVQDPIEVEGRLSKYPRVIPDESTVPRAARAAAKNRK